jgi:DNA invertase Pin-like site-specific DNA recombinase
LFPGDSPDCWLSTIFELRGGPLKVALYARVSTSDDDDKTGPDGQPVKRQDPEVQLIKLREYSDAHGWEISDVYVDRASGKDARRDRLDDLMRDAFHHRFDVVLVVRLDRMMRSLANLLNILQRLEDNQVRLVATDQMIDTSTSTGRLLTNILGALAEWEREIIRERVIDGMAKAKRNGTKSGKAIGRERLELSAEDVRAAKEAEPDVSISELARRFGVDRTTIRDRLTEGGEKGGPTQVIYSGPKKRGGAKEVLSHTPKRRKGGRP